MTYRTVTLTTDQLRLLAEILYEDASRDDNIQTRAYKLRMHTKLTKAKTS